MCCLAYTTRTPAATDCHCKDIDKQRVIGTATMFVELKFLRGCGKVRRMPHGHRWASRTAPQVGHIEDVVVNPEYRGLRLGQRCETHMIASENCGMCLVHASLQVD